MKSISAGILLCVIYLQNYTKYDKIILGENVLMINGMYDV